MAMEELAERRNVRGHQWHERHESPYERRIAGKVRASLAGKIRTPLRHRPPLGKASHAQECLDDMMRLTPIVGRYMNITKLCGIEQPPSKLELSPCAERDKLVARRCSAPLHVACRSFVWWLFLPTRLVVAGIAVREHARAGLHACCCLPGKRKKAEAARKAAEEAGIIIQNVSKYCVWR